MANEKTINLAGSEVEVKISGQNCDIRNDGTDIVYASRKANVVGGEDGVVSIPAGQAVKLLGTWGTLYLLGTGSVQLCGNDYSELVFKTSATASGEGGGVDEGARNAINTHAGNADIHLTAEDAIKAAATAISNPNLLINSWFGKSVINQRGQTEYSEANAYTVDRWKLAPLASAGTVGKVVLSFSGISLISGGNANDIYFRQIIENGAEFVGETVTLSFKAESITGEWAMGQFGGANPSIELSASGIATVTFEWVENSSNYYAIHIWNKSADATISGLEWVKFELGSVATPFTPPDPATELAKCQRYYVEYNCFAGAWCNVGDGSARSEKSGIIYVNTPVPMRTIPTISMSGNWALTQNSASTDNIPVTLGSHYTSNDSLNRVIVEVIGEGLVTGAYYMLRAYNDETARLSLSAEL